MQNCFNYTNQLRKASKYVLSHNNMLCCVLGYSKTISNSRARPSKLSNSLNLALSDIMNEKNNENSDKQGSGNYKFEIAGSCVRTFTIMNQTISRFFSFKFFEIVLHGCS